MVLKYCCKQKKSTRGINNPIIKNTKSKILLSLSLLLRNIKIPIATIKPIKLKLVSSPYKELIFPASIRLIIIPRIKGMAKSRFSIVIFNLKSNIVKKIKDINMEFPKRALFNY